MKRQSRLFTLAFPIALFAGALAVIATTLAGAARQYRFEKQSRATLLTLQRAVQDYHVALEHYPKKTPQSGVELVELLIKSGHLQTPPRNPWSGQPYAAGQPDGIRYRTDEVAETYALEALGPDLTPEQPLWQLDSTEHRSLE